MCLLYVINEFNNDDLWPSYKIGGLTLKEEAVLVGDRKPVSGSDAVPPQTLAKYYVRYVGRSIF